jgi:ADP-ribosylglycohydrolase
MNVDLLSRFHGCLLGLAIGDAVGTTLEFQWPGSFTPLNDLRGGGPFHLLPGQWTDDTSMALCLAESLIEREEFDLHDQLERYLRWYRQGHLSSTGRCFDIGNTVRQALLHFEQTGEAESGPTDPNTAGNGSLMRLAPVPMFYACCPREAMDKAAQSSRATHQAPVALDACRYFGALLVGALAGESKERLLSSHYTPVPGYWDTHALAPEISNVARGSFKARQPPQIRGSGYVAHSLEAALWAFYRSENFRDGCLLAVNLGEDADTTGAVYGQLAGAFYGAQDIPAKWRERLAHRELIESYAEKLFRIAQGKGKDHVAM